MNKRRIKKFVAANDRRLSRFSVVFFLGMLIWPACMAQTSIDSVCVVQHYNELFIFVNLTRSAFAIPRVLFIPAGFAPILIKSYERHDVLLYHVTNDVFQKYEYQNQDDATRPVTDGNDLYLDSIRPMKWNGSGLVAIDNQSGRTYSPVVPNASYDNNFGFASDKGWRYVPYDDLLKDTASEKQTSFRLNDQYYTFDLDDREISGQLASRISLQNLKPNSPRHTICNWDFVDTFCSINTYWKIAHP